MTSPRVLTSRRVLWAAAGAAVVAGSAAGMVRLGLRPESQLFGRSLVAGRDPNEIALTYDDGPNDRSTPELLEVLHRFGVSATFFMVGKFVALRPDIARQVQAAGHLLGNHTVTHPFLANKPLRLIEEELRGCNERLEDALGAPVRYFRAPYGARRPAVLRCARELGLTPVQWNVTAHDWEPIGVDGILNHIDKGLRQVRKRRRGANVLLHDGFDEQMSFDRSDTVRVTGRLLQRELAAGRRFVTVDAWNPEARRLKV